MRIVCVQPCLPAVLTVSWSAEKKIAVLALSTETVAVVALLEVRELAPLPEFEFCPIMLGVTASQ